MFNNNNDDNHNHNNDNNNNNNNNNNNKINILRGGLQSPRWFSERSSKK